MNFDNLLEQVYLQDQLNEGFFKKYALPAAAAIGLGVGTGHFNARHEQKPQTPATVTAERKPVTAKPVPSTPKPIVSKPAEDLYITNDLIKFIEDIEVRPSEKSAKEFSAYWDYDQYSIGYGTKATPDEVKNHKTINREEARDRLIIELNDHKKRVISALSNSKLTLTTNQIRALISFDYNTGLGRKAIFKSKSPQQLAQYISSIVFAGGKKLPGLQRRRAEELAQFTGWSTQKVKDKYF